MKFICTFLALAFSIQTFSQSTQSINILFKGINNNTKNYQVILDGTSYYSNKIYENSGNQNSITINNVATGKHTIKVYRLRSSNPVTKRPSKNIFVSSKPFKVREGYDMDIAINVNGKVLFSQKSNSTEPISDAKTPMADYEYNRLLQTVRSKWSQALKGETVSEAFNNPNNYFSTFQIKQLLAQISSENDKVDLAKLSYRSVTDSANFTKVYDLFKMQTSKDDLTNFLRSKGWNFNVEEGNGIKSPMADNKFNQLLQTIKSKWSQAIKGETESEAFNNPNNYFNTNQVRQLLTLITSEYDRLDLAKLSYRAITDTANFTQLYNLFRSQASKTDLNNFLISKGWNINSNGALIITPMADNKFNQLLQTVRNKWSQALKGETESEAFNNPNNYFNTNQVKQLLTLITSENDRLDLAKLSYRSVTDTANFIQLYDLFKVEANRDALNNFLNTKGWKIAHTPTSVKAPMAEADFNQLLTNVRLNLIQYLKINYETDVFNNPAYFFTTAQIMELLLLIKAEENRLELAKLSYRTVTDPANFLKLSTILNSQSSRTELANYVKTYNQK